jgi:hypothetical protein
MRKPLVSLCAAALAALVLTAGVRAENVPWGYSASTVTIDNSNTPLKTSSVEFMGSSSVATGDSGIIIYNLFTTSTVAEDTPDSFSNVPFHLGITLTDIKSGGLGKPSDTVGFDGLFNATGVSKSSTLADVASWVGSTKAEVTLGSKDSGWRKYSVTIASFTPPGQPGGDPGSIQAIVRITPTTDPGGGPGGGGTPPPDSPEPASLVLAGLGLPLVLMARRRMKKAQAV